MLRYEELEGTPLYRREVDEESVRYYIPRDAAGRVVKVEEANRLECYALESGRYALKGRPFCKSSEMLSCPIDCKEWDEHVLVKYFTKFTSVVNLLGHIRQHVGQYNGRFTRHRTGDYSVFKGVGGIRLIPL